MNSLLIEEELENAREKLCDIEMKLGSIVSPLHPTFYTTQSINQTTIDWTKNWIKKIEEIQQSHKNDDDDDDDDNDNEDEIFSDNDDDNDDENEEIKDLLKERIDTMILIMDLEKEKLLSSF